MDFLDGVVAGDDGDGAGFIFYVVGEYGVDLGAHGAGEVEIFDEEDFGVAATANMVVDVAVVLVARDDTGSVVRAKICGVRVVLDAKENDDTDKAGDKDGYKDSCGFRHGIMIT